MPSTYSINVGLPTEAHRLATIEDVLNLLPDNEEQLVNPIDLRSVAYSVWENSVFKQLTGSASIEYIGIDRSDIFNKIFFGKKQLSNIDVMNSPLLNSDVDIFFYNTKSDSNLSNQFTKLSILSGTNSNWYRTAPFIKTKTAIGPTYSQVIQLEITNPSSGNINVLSSSGRTYINDIGLPNVLEASSATNSNLLSYDISTGNLEWLLNVYTASSVGTSSTSSSILGSPISVNGYSLEMNDSREIMQDTFNSIQTGQVFNNVPLVDLIERMLYSYIPPSCSLSVNPLIGEKGNPPSISVRYTIIKETDSILNCQFPSGNVIGFLSPSPINTPGSSTVTSTVTGIAPSGFVSNYNLQITDSGISNGGIPTTVNATASFSLVYPYFFGVNSTNVSNVTQMNSILSTLSKSVESKSNKSFALSGTGYIYFAYPSSYGLLSSILDEDSNPLSYTYSIYSGPGLTSPNYYWSNTSYIVYKVGSTTVGFPNSVSWQFNY
jgi:hypothetical protein